ncbi:MAG: PIN domain-containing protein [Thermodesulfobacteriota bacterium]
MSRDVLYWDSDTFLSWLQDEKGKAEQCEGVIESAENGQLLIATSAFTLAEVLYLRGRGNVPKDKKQEVVKFFKNDYITIINVTRKIAENARDLYWDYNIHPKDAIHVATAIFKKIEELNTFDVGLLGKNGKVGNPPLRICQPNRPLQSKLQFGNGSKGRWVSVDGASKAMVWIEE